VAPSTTADRVLELLGSQGVHTTFGLPGVHNLAFWRAEPESGRPRILPVRHEQTTGYAADGLARATGGLGVALTTTGPGAANVMAAFGEAATAHSAVLVVSSEAPLGVRRPGVGRGALHEMRDQSSMFGPLAKATFSATSPDEALAMAADAVVAATTAPRGAVYLGIPADVLGSAAPAPPQLRSSAPAPPDLRDVERAAAVLGGARRVVIWAGGGCVASAAERSVTDLAWRLGAPVVTTYAARGLLGVEHPLLVDAPPHEPDVAALIASADVLLVVGSQLDGMATRNWTMPRPPVLVRIDVDERTAHEGWPPDAVVVGDAALVCDALATRIAPREPWADEVFRFRERILSRIAEDPVTADAAALLDSLDTGWPSSGDIVCDMAVAGYWAGGYAAMPRSRRLQYPVGWGTLGYALPASIGAAAGTRRPVLAVAGDGGVPFAVGELATLVQEGLPVTLLLVDDGGYGMLRYDQTVAGDAERGVDLHGPNWVALSEAYGLPARSVSSLGAPLRDALAEAAGSGGPSLLHVAAALHPPRTTSPRWQEP
jgi:acetolactate synthase I/II/III large subunit